MGAARKEKQSSKAELQMSMNAKAKLKRHGAVRCARIACVSSTQQYESPVSSQISLIVQNINLNGCAPHPPVPNKSKTRQEDRADGQ